MAKELITKKDVLRGWAKYYTCAEVSSGFERLTAPAFSFGMNDILKKLYGNNQEEYIKSLLSTTSFVKVRISILPSTYSGTN